MSFQQILEGTQLKPTSPFLIPETRCTNRALSAFFLDVTKEQNRTAAGKTPSIKRRSNPEQTDIQHAQQQMFNDLYQRIQVRRHLKGASNVGVVSSSVNSSVERNSTKQTLASLQSLCQSFVDSDSTLSLIKQEENTNQISSQMVHSPQSTTENKSKSRSKSKRGHLWSTLKVLKSQIQTQRERAVTDYNENNDKSIDYVMYSNKVRRPKLKLQIKSVSFQKKNESNRQKSLSSSHNQSIFFHNKGQEQIQNSLNGFSAKSGKGNDLAEEKKTFNVFYDNDEFMSSKYQSFKNRFDSLKQQCQKKQLDMINNSPTKQTLLSNIISTPAKRSRATTQESNTQITSISSQCNNNHNLKNENLPLPQISVFQTNPEIITISPTKKIQNYDNVSHLNLNLSEEQLQDNNLSGSFSNNSLQQQQTLQKPKIKIILKTKSENSKNSPILQINKCTSTKKATEDMNSLSFSTSPVKNKSIQIQKLQSTKKVILYSKKSSTLNLTEPAEEQKQENLANQSFFANEIFSSTTKYLDSRKNFIFSKALLHRDPQRFEKDCYQSQSFYQTSM